MRTYAFICASCGEEKGLATTDGAPSATTRCHRCFIAELFIEVESIVAEHGGSVDTQLLIKELHSRGFAIEEPMRMMTIGEDHLLTYARHHWKDKRLVRRSTFYIEDKEG